MKMGEGYSVKKKTSKGVGGEMRWLPQKGGGKVSKEKAIVGRAADPI